MPMLKTAAAVTIALIISINYAHATDWWIYNVKADRCESAALFTGGLSALRSPGALNDYFRASGFRSRTTIFRDTTGAIFGAVVTTGTGDDGGDVNYFGGPAQCQLFQKKLDEPGKRTSASELY